MKFHEQPNPGYGTQRHVSRDSRLENFVSKGDFSRIVLLADISASQPSSTMPLQPSATSQDSSGCRLTISEWRRQAHILAHWVQNSVILTASCESQHLNSEDWIIQCVTCVLIAQPFYWTFIWGLQIDHRPKLSYCSFEECLRTLKSWAFHLLSRVMCINSRELWAGHMQRCMGKLVLSPFHSHPGSGFWWMECHDWKQANRSATYSEI